MPPNLEALRRQQQEARQRHQRLAREKRLVLNKLRRAKRSATDVTSKAQRTAFWIVAMARDETAACQTYLKRHAPGAYSQDVDRETDAIIQQFLVCTSDAIVVQMQTEQDAGHPYIADATKFLLQFELFSWTKSHNLNKGVAPHCRGDPGASEKPEK